MPSLLRPIAAGLLTAQVVATLQVHQSNQALHTKMQGVMQAGYLAVPNGEALASLLTFGTALGGGLFFTLSIGGILTLATVALTRASAAAEIRADRSNHAPVWLWLILVVLVNVMGADFYLNLYLLLIPPPVYALSRRQVKQGFQGSDRLGVAAQTLPVFILAALWFSQYDQQMFIDIRDRLLLSNPVGKKVNQFYYDYTLYAAEVFKAPSQKMIKTSRIDPSLPVAHQRTLKDILTRNDWLPVKTDIGVDLWIRGEEATLELLHNDRVVIQSTISEVSSRPEPILKQFSQQNDRKGVLRTISFYGLLLGFPILLYIGVYAALNRVFALLMSPDRSIVASSAICLMLGILIWGYFQHGRIDAGEVQNTASAIASDNWRTRVAALRQFRKKGLDVRSMPAYETLKSSNEVPVRYWLVKALSASKHPQAYADLVFFLDDSSLNVRTRACEALGYRNDRRAIPELLSRLKQSDQWYFQWYAYRAIKALGWRQNASD